MTASTTTSPEATTTTGMPVPRNRPRRDWRGWIFVGPFVAVFLFAIVLPIGYALYLSLYRRQLIGGTSFVGLDNYTALLRDANFWEGLARVLLFLAVQVPVMLGLAAVAALAIDSARLHAAGFFRIVIFLPYAVPAVVACLMWGFIYGDQFGLAGEFNDLVGSDVLEPLSSTWILTSIGNVITWEYIGYNMLIFYAALRTVSSDLVEAAMLDGAGQFRVVRHVKLPALRGALVIATIFSIIGSIQLFTEPNILKPLLPNIITSDYTPNMYAFNLSLAGQQHNYAAAVAIVMGIVTAVIAYAVQLRGSRLEDR
jgi:multiple sugar transport system permease protein